MTTSDNCYKRKNKQISNYIIQKIHFKGHTISKHETLIITIINIYGDKLNFLYNNKLTLNRFNSATLVNGNFWFQGTKKELQQIIEDHKKKCFEYITF